MSKKTQTVRVFDWLPLAERIQLNSEGRANFPIDADEVLINSLGIKGSDIPLSLDQLTAIHCRPEGRRQLFSVDPRAVALAWSGPFESGTFKKIEAAIQHLVGKAQHLDARTAQIVLAEIALTWSQLTQTSHLSWIPLTFPRGHHLEFVGPPGMAVHLYGLRQVHRGEIEVSA